MARGFTGAALAAALLLVAAAAAAQPADRIWSGGTILTMDDRAMRAEAVAERGGRIVAVGEVDEPATRTIDADGKVVVMGLRPTNSKSD